MAARELAVLIVSYRRADLLDRALAGVEKYLPDAPVHVWDNRSAASPEVAALAGRPPDVTWTFSVHGRDVAHAGTVADDPLTSRRGSDLVRSAQVMVLGNAHNRGAGTVFSLGTIVLDRVQRSKRVARRRRRAASREHSGGRPAVVVTTNGLANGGPERQRVLLANALVRRHHPVTLVCLQKLGRYTAELDPRVRLVLQPWWQPVIDVAQDDAVVVGGITNTGIGFARGWRALGRLTGRRRRWLPATHDPAVAEGPTYTASQARALRSADGLLVLSPRHHADLTRHQRLTDVLMVAPNGIPAADAPPFRGGTGPIRLGMLTRVVEYKNPLLLADALDALGPDHAFAEIDVLCVPSGFEAFPLVMVEAMTRGIPVLASASGAVAEMLDDGRAGVVVEPVTREAWTAALERIVDDPVALGRLGAAGRVRALERYTDAAMADDYQRAIAHVLGRPIPGGPDAPAVLL